MMRNQIFRFFHTTIPAWSSVSKSHLAKLRKKTGYTFSNCKKALEVNDNDIVKAEKWLQEQAQALGWSKLAKLEGRVTAQGLVGIAYEGKRAALIEINCETDFVARNKYFKEMVDLTSTSCLQYIKKLEVSDAVSKDSFDGEQLKEIKGPDGKKLSDHTALLVSSVGENVSLRRGVGVGVRDDINLACYVHPDQSDSNKVMNGKYGAVIMYTAIKNDAATAQLVRELCQHVIGMNPKRIKKDPSKGTDVEEVKNDNEARENIEKEDDALMSQSFLLDPTITVQELLIDSGVTICDFVRFETGEKLASHDVPEPEIKASQIGG